MRPFRPTAGRGQANIEYALLIALVAINVIAGLILFLPRFTTIDDLLTLGNNPAPPPESVPLISTPGSTPESAPLASTPGSMPESAPIASTPGSIPEFTPAPEHTGQTEMNAIAAIANDFMARIRAYHDRTGKWPRGNDDRRFTDLGLNPDDWEEAVYGILWNPAGERVALENQKKDDLQVYVTDLKGNRLHLYDGWKIWCMAETGACYYHTVAPGNEVDLNTVEIVEQKYKNNGKNEG